MSQIPLDFSSADNLKYLSLRYNLISEIPEDICSLRQLNIMEIEFEAIESVPHCVGSMNQLKAIWIENCFYLTDIPLSMFNLPDLLELSLYFGDIDYHNLIEYNVPEDINNDTDAVDQWIDDNFIFDFDRIDYWLSRHPICNDNRSGIAVSVQRFLNGTCDVEDLCADAAESNIDTDFCAPRKLGDGKCLEIYCLLEFIMILTTNNIQSL